MEVPKEELDLGINLVWMGKTGFIFVMFQPLRINYLFSHVTCCYT